MELTLLTINTWKADGDYYNRREVLKEGLKKSGAQLILCQECFLSIDGTIDTLEYLSQALGMRAYATLTRRKPRLLNGNWVDSFSGMGMLTTLPVSDRMEIELPSDPADGGRKAQLLTIELSPGKTLLIANLHLTHLPDDDLRRCQLQTVLEAVRNSTATIRIIGGDWNTAAGSAILCDMERSESAADCYVLGQGVEPRYTLKDHPICVDHFYTLPSKKELSTYPSFIHAGVVLDRPDEATGLYPSDHFGIRVTLIY